MTGVETKKTTWQKKELFEVMSINIENKVTVNTVSNANSNGINTIPAEYQALGFIQGLLCRQIDPARIAIRDARSYCALLVDDNNRKTLCRLFLESSKKKIELPKINKTIEIKDIYEIKKAKSALFEVLNILENKGLETVKEPLQLPEPQPVDINRELTLQAQHNQAESVADFVESEPLQVIEPPTLPEPEQQQPEPYTVRPGQPPMSYLDEVTPRPEATATETKNPSWME